MLARALAGLLVVLSAHAAVADRVSPREIAPKPVPRRPRPPAPPPAPPPDIAAAAKPLVGAWSCKGTVPRGDGSSASLTATLTIKLDLAGAWLVGTFVEEGAGGEHRVSYRTYDATARQWTRIDLTSAGGHGTSTSPGEASGEWLFSGAVTNPSGTIQVRDHEQLADKQLKLWGEALLGGTWQKAYEITCSR